MRFPIKITENFFLEAVMHTFGVKAETSFVEVTDETIEVQMGRWFHEKLPLAAISVVAPSDWPWWGGLGVKLHHHGVGVVGSLDGIVNIQFKSKQQVRAVVEVSCEQLWLSLEDPTGFLEAVSRAAGVTISNHIDFSGKVAG